MPCQSCKEKARQLRERIANMTKQQLALSATNLKTLRWSSHIPINKAVLKSFQINGVLELGAGNNSTRMFLENGVEFISIESDKDWIESLNIPNVIHYPAEGITRSTLRQHIPKQLLDDTIDFYISKKGNHNFLFIDCYAGFRLEALQRMHNLFDVIVFHDYEEREDKNYGYSKFKPDSNYRLFKDKTWVANCGIVIKEDLMELFPTFYSNFETECKQFANQFKCFYKVQLEEIIK